MLDPDLAYVQGMSFLAAMILNLFEIKDQKYLEDNAKCEYLET